MPLRNVLLTVLIKIYNMHALRYKGHNNNVFESICSFSSKFVLIKIVYYIESRNALIIYNALINEHLFILII